MEKTQITQCPKCDTTFKVTPAQLNIAKGAVRCGACLHVFRASDHFQNTQDESSIKDDRTQDMFSESLFETPADQSALIVENDEFDINTPEEAATENPSRENEVLAENNPLSDEGLIHDDMQNDEDLIHDDMDSDLIHDDIEQSAPANASLDFNPDFLSINADQESDPFFNDSEKLAEPEQINNSNDESWAQALLDDSDEEDIQPTPAKQQPVKTNKPTPTSIKPQAFSYIEVDPLDLSLPKQRSRAKLWLSISACLVLTATLILQLAYFNFEQWARQSNMRPWYQMACEQIGCTLPSSYDLNKIRTTTSPQVSSHAKFENALSVDVLFMNHANYQQAFPRLELTFSDHNDKVIAQRLFTPDEYLAGEAAGLSLMPIQTPIHIALEIRDPGTNASNYSVRFLAP